MAFSEDRRQNIIKDIADTAGLSVVIDYCSSTNELLAAMLRSGETATPDLVSQLAMHQCMQEIVHEVYHVNPEILELEKQKCYINFEEIVNDARAKAVNGGESNVIQFAPEFAANPAEVQPGDIGQVIDGIMQSIATAQPQEVEEVTVDYPGQLEKVDNDGDKNDG